MTVNQPFKEVNGKTEFDNKYEPENYAKKETVRDGRDDYYTYYLDADGEIIQTAHKHISRNVEGADKTVVQEEILDKDGETIAQRFWQDGELAARDGYYEFYQESFLDNDGLHKTSFNASDNNQNGNFENKTVFTFKEGNAFGSTSFNDDDDKPTSDGKYLYDSFSIKVPKRTKEAISYHPTTRNTAVHGETIYDENGKEVSDTTKINNNPETDNIIDETEVNITGESYEYTKYNKETGNIVTHEKKEYNENGKVVYKLDEENNNSQVDNLVDEIDVTTTDETGKSTQEYTRYEPTTHNKAYYQKTKYDENGKGVFQITEENNNPKEDNFMDKKVTIDKTNHSFSVETEPNESGFYTRKHAQKNRPDGSIKEDIEATNDDGNNTYEWVQTTFIDKNGYEVDVKTWEEIEIDEIDISNKEKRQLKKEAAKK